MVTPILDDLESEGIPDGALLRVLRWLIQSVNQRLQEIEQRLSALEVGE